MGLESQDEIAADPFRGDGWHQSVLQALRQRLEADPDFPCLFSKNAFARRLVKFILVEDRAEADIRRLAGALRDYVEISRDWDGSLGTAYPLVTAFSQRAVRCDTVEGYHAFGWDVLQKLHALDTATWPDRVADDPNAPYWSMCFHGMELFVNMSCPAHQARRSRNLGEHFLFIINPRARFDVVAGNTPAGRKVRETIRIRIDRYDGQPHCPQLGSYLAGEIEWWQYGLTDTNQDHTDRCPFTMHPAALTRHGPQSD